MRVKVQQGREEINSIGGISLIGGLYNSLKSVKKADSMQTSKIKTGKIKHSGIIKTVAGLFAGLCFKQISRKHNWRELRIYEKSIHKLYGKNDGRFDGFL